MRRQDDLSAFVNVSVLYFRHQQYPQLYFFWCYAFSKAFASQVLISAADGMRPVETTFSLMTNPGVDMTLYAMMSGYSVTLMISACCSHLIYNLMGNGFQLFAIGAT